MAAQMLQAVAMLQVLIASAGSAAQEARLLRGAVNQTAPRSLKSWEGCKSLTAYSHECDCVDSIYEDKCAGCMCGGSSTAWCSTDCDPSGDDEETRRNSCCMPFKKEGERCGQNWECGPRPGGPLCWLDVDKYEDTCGDK
eukprot:CAMPEP_0197620156 /NCGR_PEP_ID=MMETSP1338-20131121/1023_1 /TAXON_ID=43686 ORGANISM="Pelagodinium beii, Strain RCC1491" /NCGR_SAMPLE_ID=MMETSP1338 /ASSEMBLY_ACC=CAM_ASM_000754 /LENGTH=139 /DNA_ID=CAMNT_0043189251 /DNA_START=100 /DNA_END=519 /DNA_ORIENTATION=-